LDTAPVTGILSLTDLTGKTILKTVFVNQKEINLKGISKGIYLLSIENEKQSLKRKLVVE